jgi:hypothetical protein
MPATKLCRSRKWGGGGVYRVRTIILGGGGEWTRQIRIRTVSFFYSVRIWIQVGSRFFCGPHKRK